MDDVPRRMAARSDWLISQLAVHVRRLAFASFDSVGARGYHYRILAVLAEVGPASQAELGRRGRIDRSDVVTAVNELVERGFVERLPDPEHGRRNRVILTSGGAQQLRRLDDALDQMQDTLLEPLSGEERQALTDLLTRVLAQHESR
ncbi:MarR family transcriptional regulator [Spiractinospora alimapuensis]|uniref:MarR family winged helix-turn-helix transcriptional regulator n=1 Tax=Spiractinospora alimapuensis TaxID=2820884 RepID=UPI001F2427D8|nr:MarR family transcriptional regulator [Spiractinospora alimapuensis]QVQ51530.1 MarR family transcriptional regulator [Spiractinospora alimapuensis]